MFDVNTIRSSIFWGGGGGISSIRGEGKYLILAVKDYCSGEVQGLGLGVVGTGVEDQFDFQLL